LVAAALVLAAAIVRVLGARGDLWLDEIWSMELARVAGSAVGVFTQLHHDNNHHLNTLWLVLVGYDAGPVAVRLLAILAGTAMVAVAALGGGRDRALALGWSFLLAFSCVLVHYGSEARGYGPALLFAVAAYVALDRLLATGRASSAASPSPSCLRSPSSSSSGPWTCATWPWGADPSTGSSTCCASSSGPPTASPPGRSSGPP
jgi:uncharacterized membrane protein